MADPIWVDGTTPLNSVNMTKLQTRDEKNAPSGYVGLNATSQIVFQGDASANLYRESASVVKTDGHLVAAGQVHSNRSTPLAIILSAVGANPGILFGNALDTNLYRSAAGTLRTNGPYFAITHDSGYLYFGTLDDTSIGRYAAGVLYTPGTLRAGGHLFAGDSVYVGVSVAPDTRIYRRAANVIGAIGSVAIEGAATGWGFMAYASGETQPRSYLRNDGQLLFGSGTASPDTNLYRVIAGQLKTDGFFISAGLLSTTTVYINDSGAIDGNTPYINKIGSLALFTNGSFSANTSLVANYSNQAGRWNGLLFGSAQDVSLWRSAAGALQTDGTFSAAGFVDANTGNANRTLLGYRPGVGNAPGITFGSGLDTTLYRYAANVLATPGFLRVDGSAANGGSSSGLLITFGIYGARWVDVGVPDSGGTGYRAVIVSN